MRDELTAQFEAEAQKSENRPVELYDIYMGDQVAADSLTYYFCTNNAPVQFWNLDGQVKTYLPLRITRTAVPTSGDMSIEAVSGEFDNADGLWDSFLSSSQAQIRGKRVVVRRAFLDLLTSEDHAKKIFSGIINGIRQLDDTKATIECKSNLRSLQQETGCLEQASCVYIFGDEFCGFDVNSTKVTGQTVDSGTTDYIIDAARTEAASYWDDGIITFTSGDNYGKSRKVIYDNATHKLTFDYALPVAAAVGDTYTLTQGCDKTYDVCSGRFSNQANMYCFKFIAPLMNPIL